MKVVALVAHSCIIRFALVTNSFMPILDLTMPAGKKLKKLSPVCTEEGLNKVKTIIDFHKKIHPFYGVTDLFRDLVNAECDRINQLAKV